ncbi:hypothetical protein [Vibrio sp. TBV020]|uniref:hypothetical protein n=1 Tax=Vibrio sp. TBV020 TaxID=3137398 RepID=UPI0038CD6D67
MVQCNSHIAWLLAYPPDSRALLAESFIEVMRDDAMVLRKAHNTGGSLVEPLHKIKGGLAMIGYDSLYEKAKMLLDYLLDQMSVEPFEIDWFVRELESSVASVERWFFDSDNV